MLGEEVVDRFRRSAVGTHRLKCKRLEDRACCRAEVVVLDMLLALGPCGAHRVLLRSSCADGSGWCTRRERSLRSWLVSPMGLVEVTSICQFLAVGLSMVVMPDKRMSACMLVLAKGLALVAVMCV